ncbi:MAG: flagellar M-ring protein FliF C-terminal domain-containing protein, partial [Parvibaculum sp.]|nr:flagellar M-ring protein FliF C-terminal domain-containing protein [Parvibaculum sp.]
DGNTVYTPRTDQELQKIEALVKSAIGFDTSRGDQVEIVNLQFVAAPALDAGTAAGDEASGLMDFTRADIIRIAEMLVLAILALIAMLFVMRPLLSRIFSGSPLPGQISYSTGGGQAVLAGPDEGDASAGALPAPDQLSEDMMIDIAQVAGKVKQSSVRKIGELVTNHPDESISILRSWLHETV